MSQKGITLPEDRTTQPAPAADPPEIAELRKTLHLAIAATEKALLDAVAASEARILAAIQPVAAETCGMSSQGHAHNKVLQRIEIDIAKSINQSRRALNEAIRVHQENVNIRKQLEENATRIAALQLALDIDT